MVVTEGQLISDGTAVWKVKKIGNGELPVGTIQMFAGNTIPAGWLLCDGSAVSRTDYAKLFSAIGTTWGAGDGSTTFNLPNTIGRFAEGASEAGSYHEAGLPNIDGSISGGIQTQCAAMSGITKSGAFLKTNQLGVYSSNYNNTRIALNVNFNASYSNTIYGNSTTVQPASYTVRKIIKY